ncbi:zinc ribbon domain-containing protein [Chloroflexota bacterium]
MITCPECGHENVDCASACANCGKNLRPARGGPEVENDKPDDLEAIQDHLELPDAGGDVRGSAETAEGALLFSLLMRPRDTARDVAAMDPGALFRTVAYMRKKEFSAGTVDPSLTDEQIVEVILAYARSVLPDARAGEVRRGRPGSSEEGSLAAGEIIEDVVTGGADVAVVLLLWRMLPPWGRIGAIAGILPGVLVLLVAAFSEAIGSSGTGVGLLGILGIGLATVGAVVGAVLGTVLGAIAKRSGLRITGKG